MMQPGIILLKEGTDTSQGKGQLISNINACQVWGGRHRVDLLLLQGGLTSMCLLALVINLAGGRRHRSVDSWPSGHGQADVRREVGDHLE